MGKLNLQMYSFLDGTMNDSKENLKLTAEMGFSGVELFGPNLEIPAEEMKGLLADLKLEAVSLHAPKTDMVEQLIPYAVALGMKYIGIGMEVMKDDAAVHAFTARLNEIGAKCKESGLNLTYHNHTQEFLPCEDRTVYEVLMDETNPEYVEFELDAGWAAAAGVDPLMLLQKYSGRIPLVHVKESDKVIGPQPVMDFDAIEKDENGQPIFTDEMKAKMERDKQINCKACEGLVDWKKLKEVADHNGTKAYIVERESSVEGTRLERLKSDINAYKSIF